MITNRFPDKNPETHLSRQNLIFLLPIVGIRMLEIVHIVL